jgi:hypothetical protein
MGLPTGRLRLSGRILKGVRADHGPDVLEEFHQLAKHVAGLTCAEVGAVLGVLKTQMRTEAHAGRITHRRIGAQYHFTRDDIYELIEYACRAGAVPCARSPRRLAAMKMQLISDR